MTKKHDPGKITGKDIAKIAGVSQSTVSRVLGSGGDSSSLISKETAEKIKRIADELGYSPNPIARALRGEKTNLIGLIVREIADPFFAGIIEKINISFKNKGFNVILAHVHSDPNEARQITKVLDARQCDGMIFLGDLYDDLKYITETRDSGHPAIAMCRGSQEEKIPFVNCDNEMGTRLIIDHMYSLGHRNFAFIDGGSIGDIRERRKAFEDLESRNMEVTCSIIKAERNDYKGGFDAMHELLNQQQVPTAIIAADDGMAIGALKAIDSSKYRVPTDISIAGFDDIELSRYSIPSITTIHQPISEMAEIGADMLIKMINNVPISNEEQHISIEPKLIIRDSTGPVNLEILKEWKMSRDLEE